MASGVKIGTREGVLQCGGRQWDGNNIEAGVASRMPQTLIRVKILVGGIDCTIMVGVLGIAE